MKMHIGGQWVDKSEKIEVLHPFDGSVVDTIPRGDAADVELALATAERGAKVMANLTGYERYEILHKAAHLMEERNEDLARTITLEEGKIIAEGRIEASRAVEIIALSAEEAKRLGGEVVPLDGAPGVAGKFGFTLRVPCGVIVGISPFNFPLHLVCHKIGPALAAGNAIILKPATDTPLSALKLVEIFLEAGTPPEALQCLTGLRRRHRRCALRRFACAQNHLHRQPRHRRAYLPHRRPEAGHDGTWLERSPHRHAGRRPRTRSPGRSSFRLLQRRPGLHLHPARCHP